MHIATPGQPLGVPRAAQVASRLSMSANRCIGFRFLAKVTAPGARDSDDLSAHALSLAGLPADPRRVYDFKVI